MSNLTVTTVIKSVSEVVEGVSKAGKAWKKVEFITDNGEQYDNLAKFEIFGEEKVDKFMQYNKAGDNVEVSFNIKCSEYNGRHYTDLSAWKVWKVDAAAANAAVESVEPTQSDDLPF